MTTKYHAYIIKPMFDMDMAKGCETEEEADEIGLKYSTPVELDPDDDPNHYEKYDPPMVLVMEGDQAVWDNGKYTRPVSLWMRGEKWRFERE